jgi:hypothetical protein
MLLSSREFAQEVQVVNLFLIDRRAMLKCRCSVHVLIYNYELREKQDPHQYLPNYEIILGASHNLFPTGERQELFMRPRPSTLELYIVLQIT